MNFRLVISQEILQVVGNALLKLPAEQSLTAINEINKQVNDQLQDRQRVNQENAEQAIQDRIDAALTNAEPDKI